ncbi:hypothetical protein G6F37_000181 [Rhizopus arrhizus]|nr:hypothetical protein G6F38_004690 [Rhizopus arrhizus]KAG1164561.1 hypothetical protein G6F37_000181 [Rhizopus arrhizus]
MKKKLPAEKGAILKSGQSTGPKIKHHVQDLYFEKQYHNPERIGQRGLFTKEEWLELNSKWNKQKNWYPLDDDVQRMLKTIENLAVNDLKKAYVKTLSYQIKYALTENEAYFEAYTCVLKTLYKKKILSSPSNTKFTEANDVINVWSKIFQFVFEDSANNLFCKWEDLVATDSSNSKKESQQDDDVTISDKPPGLKSREKRNIAGCCMQIADVEGQAMSVHLVDQGLYVTKFDKSSDSKSMERKLKIKRSSYESSSNESSDKELSDQEVSEEETSEEEVPSEEVSGVHKDTKYTG